MPEGRAPLRFSDFARIGGFQGHFWKVMSTLGYIAHNEALVIKGTPDEPTLEEWFPEHHAQEVLPLWVDLFYVYFRILADRLCVTLGYLASDKPRGWPGNFRTLADADVKKVRHWGVADAEQLVEAIRANRVWFDHLTTKGNEGIRDAIVHQLARPVVVTRTEDDGMRSVIVWRETPKGYEERDLLALIPEVVRGFCSMLAALPTRLWTDESFVLLDLVPSDGRWLAVERFFPSVTALN